jgi:hypothetical protein
LYKIVTRHDLCAKRLCLLFQSGRDIDGIADKRWAKACKYPPAEPGALGIGPLEAAVRIADAILHLLAT